MRFFSECWHKTFLFSEFFEHIVKLQLGSSVRGGGGESPTMGCKPWDFGVIYLVLCTNL